MWAQRKNTTVPGTLVSIIMGPLFAKEKQQDSLLERPLPWAQLLERWIKGGPKDERWLEWAIDSEAMWARGIIVLVKSN